MFHSCYLICKFSTLSKCLVLPFWHRKQGSKVIRDPNFLYNPILLHQQSKDKTLPYISKSCCIGIRTSPVRDNWTTVYIHLFC